MVLNEEDTFWANYKEQTDSKDKGGKKWDLNLP